MPSRSNPTPAAKRVGTAEFREAAEPIARRVVVGGGTWGQALDAIKRELGVSPSDRTIRNWAEQSGWIAQKAGVGAAGGQDRFREMHTPGTATWQKAQETKRANKRAQWGDTREQAASVFGIVALGVARRIHELTPKVGDVQTVDVGTDQFGNEKQQAIIPITGSTIKDLATAADTLVKAADRLDGIKEGGEMARFTAELPVTTNDQAAMIAAIMGSREKVLTLAQPEAIEVETRDGNV